MESIDQIMALSFMGDRQVAARVDYQTCERCGFHLMRVETTIIGDQQLTVKSCSICEQFYNHNSQHVGAEISTGDRLHQFDLWLGTHGLNRESLELHYHLKAEHFFD